ncbi:hypothetical protein DL98DRAFT_303838 [Cadophora sp. DSE1049]|nr:hypothetical protein DL98DRAFT_303838 [Cadophora sp. DSE1049]
MATASQKPKQGNPPHSKRRAPYAKRILVDRNQMTSGSMYRGCGPSTDPTLEASTSEASDIPPVLETIFEDEPFVPVNGDHAGSDRRGMHTSLGERPRTAESGNHLQEFVREDPPHMNHLRSGSQATRNGGFWSHENSPDIQHATVVRLSPVPLSPDPGRESEVSYISFDDSKVQPEPGECHDIVQEVADVNTPGDQLLHMSQARPRNFLPPPVRVLPPHLLHTVFTPGVSSSVMRYIITRFHVYLGPSKVYNLDVLLWKQSADFFSWYVVEEHFEVSVLRIAIFNARSDFERDFYITRGDEQAFQELKKYIWDFFWVASDTRPGIFAVQVLPHPLPSETFRYSLTGADVLAPGSRDLGQGLGCQHIVSVVLRLQLDASGKLSHPYDRFVLRDIYTVTQFFEWFAAETTFDIQEGPLYLRFTFRDAMPLPTSRIVGRTSQDAFNKLRDDLESESQDTGIFFGIREFSVVVSVPGWTPKED